MEETIFNFLKKFNIYDFFSSKKEEIKPLIIHEDYKIPTYEEIFIISNY